MSGYVWFALDVDADSSFCNWSGHPADHRGRRSLFFICPRDIDLRHDIGPTCEWAPGSWKFPDVPAQKVQNCMRGVE